MALAFEGCSDPAPPSERCQPCPVPAVPANGHGSDGAWQPGRCSPAATPGPQGSLKTHQMEQ